MVELVATRSAKLLPAAAGGGLGQTAPLLDFLQEIAQVGGARLGPPRGRHAQDRFPEMTDRCEDSSRSHRAPVRRATNTPRCPGPRVSIFFRVVFSGDTSFLRRKRSTQSKDSKQIVRQELNKTHIERVRVCQNLHL